MKIVVKQPIILISFCAKAGGNGQKGPKCLERIELRVGRTDQNDGNDHTKIEKKQTWDSEKKIM